MSVSIAPDGAVFQIPEPPQLETAWQRLKARAEAARTSGGQVVAVQGLGFVGAAVAAVVAGARDDSGKPRFFVLGTDLATPGGYWKIAKINEGLVPIPSPDPALTELIATAVLRDGNLGATASAEAYELADVIIVDLPLDVSDRFIEKPEEIEICLDPFEGAVRTVGRHMRSDALVIIESTVPVGICEKVVRPILERERAARGIGQPVLLAHAYERVTPGPKYVDSIRNFWRTFSGVDEASAGKARAFLSSFINTAEYPLWDLGDPYASELAKLLENSYRAVNIAFIHEWTLLAERIGVNLFEVIDSIRVRKGTHDNMRQPGFGVGGYCLTKDPLLAQWSATKLFDTGLVLGMTLEALRINQRMPLHTFDLAVELAGGSVAGKRIAVCGVTYLPEVPDTRNTPTEDLVDALSRAGALVAVHDPYLAHWPERGDFDFHRDLGGCLSCAEGVIVAVPHRAYRNWCAADLLAHQECRFLINAQNGIGDRMAAALHDGGMRVAGVGKGHWRKAGFHNSP